MYQYPLHQRIIERLKQSHAVADFSDKHFYTRFVANASSIQELYQEIYGSHERSAYFFEELLQTIIDAYTKRPAWLKEKDLEKEEKGHWFLSNELVGMSLYVDRFSENLKGLNEKIPYFNKVGVNLLHLMPLFESPRNESDGGYAVSDFRKVDERFGSMEDLQTLRKNMEGSGMYLMLDIVLNHTSQHHPWAEKAKQGDASYQDYYYMYDDRTIPDQFDRSMPDIFPESSPGNFKYVEACRKWTMTVFHQYQWDLNYRNPAVFIEMLDNIFFYANLGVDILRIDAPAFIWKEIGTTCQNLPQAHTLLKLIKQCVQVSATGMALLGEAIVAPSAIMKYFGSGAYTARECDLAYNATQMALQWDALATGDTKVMLAGQHDISQKPIGCSWITYTRSHDDIGLGYEDYMIQQAGFNAFEHRGFLKNYYSGNYPESEAMGALFSVNPKTQDARISGSLASLCGLEKAINEKDKREIDFSIRKILMMQAQSFLLGGIPMIFYGDEMGYTNDYSYLQDKGKSYDNRWMHRPLIDWTKNKKAEKTGTTEEIIFSGTRKLAGIRKELSILSDHKNITWLTPHNIHVAGFLRTEGNNRIYCLFNYIGSDSFLTWYTFKQHGNIPEKLYDYWEEKEYVVGRDHEYLVIKPYSFLILEVIA